MPDEAKGAPRYDVFLSYGSTDRVHVDELFHLLDQRGIRAFQDHRTIDGGDLWQRRLARELARSRAFVACLGSAPREGWFRTEIREALNRSQTDSTFLVIPLLFPGARSAEELASIGFLGQYQFIDFRAGIAAGPALDRLVRVLAANNAERIASRRPTIPHDGPFPGLEPFGEARAPYFFGRRRECAELLSRMESGPFTAVVGGPGSGKSSFLRAGIVPALRASEGHPNPWKVAYLRPGEDPQENLHFGLVDAGLVPDGLGRATLRGFLEKLRRSPSHRGRYLVIIDQFEDIFRSFSAELREDFLRDLLSVFSLHSPAFHLLLAVSAEYYSDVLNSSIGSRVSKHQLSIVVSPEVVRKAIEGPMERAGVGLAPGLVDRITADLENLRTSQIQLRLSALQITMRTLWAHRGGPTISHKDYDDG